MRLDKAVRFVRGPKGTTVKLTVKKVDGSIVIIAIVRDIVIIEETYAKSVIVKDPESNKRIGYIYLPSFYVNFNEKDGGRRSADDVLKEINKLKAEKVDALIIDLRNDGGGSLSDVVKMAGYFIPQGPIVQVKQKTGTAKQLSDTDPRVQYDGPVAVMVNSNSASASEIFAAAMQDYKRAVVIGSKQTYGKGTVQTVMDLNRYYNFDGDLGGMTLTIQKFYRISGGSTQLEGVKPDVILPSRYTYMDIGEKELDNPLPWDQIKKANFDQWNNYSNFDQVVLNSLSRINQSPQFILIDENAKWLKEIQDDNNVSLNYDAYTNDIEVRTEESKKFKTLSKYETGLTFSSPQYELPLIRQDSILGKKRMFWHTSLSKDIYIEEGLHILGDLELKHPHRVLIKN